MLSGWSVSNEMKEGKEGKEGKEVETAVSWCCCNHCWEKNGMRFALLGQNKVAGSVSRINALQANAHIDGRLFSSSAADPCFEQGKRRQPTWSEGPEGHKPRSMLEAMVDYTIRGVAEMAIRRRGRLITLSVALPKWRLEEEVG